MTKELASAQSLPVRTEVRFLAAIVASEKQNVSNDLVLLGR